MESFTIVSKIAQLYIALCRSTNCNHFLAATIFFTLAYFWKAAPLFTAWLFWIINFHL